MIKKRAFFIIVSLSWPLVANMPMPPLSAEQICANKKIGESCGSGYGDNICKMIRGKIQCDFNNRSEQPEVTAKNDIIDEQEIVNTSDGAVGCASAGIPNVVSLTSIILGLLLVLRKRTK